MRRYQAMALDAGLHGTPLFSTFLEVICVAFRPAGLHGTPLTSTFLEVICVVFRPWHWTRDCMAPR